ncbi:hypothetical protein COCSADRAFT_223861 [Bipolaris sorokiniana ND90Pr]|uniref:Uncharacterized protein n=1 Tax=Cochliobolus sativus (strain ND90Pr / ATCC 201652) TaxID=665912 RepID=M2T136_COCSN|nr:uncharacterized protein COCSADRAFT_223861 [Bipolaris sorokiniana ND90Pr]EMD62727.1 hypothetical protein COCSADRAFT_223861 [Bipolaris sorokiniana ND90Pr]
MWSWGFTVDEWKRTAPLLSALLWRRLGQEAFRQMDSSWAVSACTQLMSQGNVSFARLFTSPYAMLSRDIRQISARH